MAAALDVIREGVRRLQAAGVESARSDVEWLLSRIVAAKPMDNADFDTYWRKDVVAAFAGYALREIRGDDMSATRLRIARQTL